MFSQVIPSRTEHTHCLPATPRPFHHKATRGAPCGGAGVYDELGLMPVRRGRGLVHLMGDRHEPHDTAAGALCNQASDSLSNTLLKVTGPEFKGTPQEAATAVLDQYHLLRHTQVMPDAASKGALMEVITRAATSGKKEVLASLLNSELPDLGTVRSFLGETKAATLVAQAGTQFDQGQRKRLDDEVLPHMLASDDGSLNIAKFESWYTDPANKDYISAATVHGILNRNRSALAHQQTLLEKANIQGAVIASEYEAQKKVDAALSAGTLWETQGTNTPQVLTTSGAVKAFDVKGYAEQALKAKTAALPFDQQVSAWSMNGLTNPDWDNQLNPSVSVKVNGTLYLRSELPTAPSSGASQGEWLERFIDAVPKARASLRPASFPKRHTNALSKMVTKTSH